MSGTGGIVVAVRLALSMPCTSTIVSFPSIWTGVLLSFGLQLIVVYAAEGLVVPFIHHEAEKLRILSNRRVVPLPIRGQHPPDRRRRGWGGLSVEGL